VPTDDDRAAEPDLAIDAVEYRPVWQHANAWGGDAYADWFCQTYVTVASSLVDLPAHSFAWRRYPGDAARGMSIQDGQPFTPAEAAPLTLCDRCRAPSQPAGAWNFDKRDGTCLRDLVCPNCGLASHQSGSWNPANWQESSLVKKTERMGRDAGCAGGQAVAERNVQSESLLS
jgi:hypothetical protein